MERNHKIVISVVGIFIILIALLSVTFAYFLTKVVGNSNENSIYITTANLRLIYSDDGDLGEIVAEHIYPGTTVASKRFTVTNDGDTDIDEYVVHLENIINDFKVTSDLELTITCDSDISEEKNDCNGFTGIYPTKDGQLISNSIKVGEVHTYVLSVLYKETYTDQSDDMGKTIKGKIQIYDPKDLLAKSERLASVILENAKTATGTNSVYSETPISIPIVNSSGESERTLSKTVDSDGPSYYFRGNVEDNYLEFNNMCWRIVRIEGDGSIKVVLTKEGSCSSITESDTNSALINNAEDVFYNNIWLKLDAWYSSSGLNALEDKLKKDTWCLGYESNGNIYDPNNSWTLLDWTLEDQESYDNFYAQTQGSLGYIAAKRIENLKTTSLTCEGEAIIESYIGSLSIDEYQLAGGTTSSVYLSDNINKNYWTVTYAYKYWKPEYYAIGKSNYYTNFSSYYNSGNEVSDTALRPSITLISDTRFVEGNGTQTSPYIVN